MSKIESALIHLAFNIILQALKRLAAKTDNDIDDIIVREISAKRDEIRKILRGKL